MVADGGAVHRRPRIFGDTVVFEDFRDDKKGEPGLEEMDSNIYAFNMKDAGLSAITKNPAIQLTPDISTRYTVWQDFRNSKNPNFIGSKDQVDIYGKRHGDSAELRLTNLPGVAFHPRVSGERVYYRWRPPGQRIAGIFVSDIQ